MDSNDKHRMKPWDRVGAGLAVGLGVYIGGVFFLDTFFHLTSTTRGVLQGFSVPLGIGVAGFIIVVLEKSRGEARQRKLELIEEKAEKEPEKAKFAWDVASAKLENYFDRNLAQVKWIFWLAIIAMFMGFVLVSWGIVLSMQSTTHETAWVAAVSGILTEFISVTFMVIYRSTMTQAKTFVQVLEKINTVGMSVQILDSLPDGPEKNTTRAELVKLLLSPAAHLLKEK